MSPPIGGFQQDYETLGSVKGNFLLRPTFLELSLAFEDFRFWLQALHSDFLKGFTSKNTHPSNEKWVLDWREIEADESASGGTPIPFDDETLGGRVDYSSVIGPARRLTGKLRGLIIRYDARTGTV